MKPKILVTGGAGFIGSEFVRQGVQKGLKIAVIDKLTYAGDRERLKSVKNQYTFYKIDIAQKNKLETVFHKEKPQHVIHFAAETHVDRSIQNNDAFIQTNVIGTQNLIDISRKFSVKKFVHISTDEVYGDSHNGKFKESSPLKPNNPYAATKAAAEHLVRAAIRTFHFPAVIIRPANNYGQWQYPEKFIPVIVLKASRNQKVPVYGKGEQIREWLHVTDCADAIHLITQNAKSGQIFNIGSYFEQNNLTTAKQILKLLKKPEQLIQFVKDRPGHDFRYSVDCSELRKLGWRPKMNLKNGMPQTIAWYQEHMPWVEKKLDVLEDYWKNVYKK